MKRLLKDYRRSKKVLENLLAKMTKSSKDKLRMVGNSKRERCFIPSKLGIW